MTDVLRTVGRFELLREVGRGGMAVVWLARQTDLERMVALKELAPFHAADPAFAARFLRESRIAGSLNHPNIVTVHDYLESEGTPYISMEYMEHGSLRPLIGQLTLAQVAYVLEGMLAGLAYAEGQGIVHRDLKPENVMVRGDGQVKIADFGIAKAFNQASSGGFHTVTGTTVGTPAYMAPEQAMAKALGPYTDLYSTGVVAYEMLVGQVPFSDTETPVAILMRHVNDPPPAPRSIKPELDAGIEAWLLKMLEKNPADRYQHATDAWDALEEIVVDVVGPRWRRDARVLGLGGGSYTPTPLPIPSIPKIATPPPVNAPPPPAVPPAQVDSFEWPSQAGDAPEQPAPEAPAPLGPMVDPFLPVEPNATAAPRVVPQADSFEWPSLETPPAAPKPTRSRKPLAIGLAIVVLIGGGIAAAIALTGGGSSSGLSTVTTTPTNTVQTRTTVTKPITTKLLPDPVVPAARRPALSPGAGALYATMPGGRIARLNPRTLRQLALANDAARPRALAVLGRSLVVADDHTITRYRADTLAPVGVSAFGPAPVLGGGGREPLVAATGHRLCLVGASALGPCAHVSFAPTGVGARADGTVLAVDGKAGVLATFVRKGTRLVPSGTPIALGKRAHGPVVVVGARAYVPISRGVAIVDLASHKVESTVDLQVTPGTLVLADGRLLVPLPARGGAAIVTLAGAVSGFVATGPLAYTAAAGTGSLAYVANAGSGTVTLVDVVKKKALRQLRISSLRGAAVPRAVVRSAVVAEAGGHVTLTLRLGPGALDAGALTLPGSSIAKGAAVLELWQGGIGAAVGRASGSGLTATVTPAPGRVIVRLSAAAGAFTAISAVRSAGGREVVVTLTPKPVVTHTGGGGGGTSSGGGGGGGGTTTTGGGGGGGTTTTGGGGGGIGNF